MQISANANIYYVTSLESDHGEFIAPLRGYYTYVQ